ncbi:cobaltochelatase subunit CobN [Pseudoalteromonas denitrificans]|uniref:Cobaltochelatase CobN n=1 Tax=Pseudoalteromonas denitrificans DSM 6059 TaxID=1123010 RepID=A0A1I1PSQ8_9GAMM|nr:cobaltochelatase subunit CobN [Pseudoalteromonas denitrificans]SFD12785.1 cobaltochelatase CobN [Pseudoalteromonas denitrificans DSM 6059]
MRFLISFSIMIFSLFIFTQAAYAQSKPDVLLMMSGHAAKAKGELLVSLSKNQPFNFINFSTKGKSEQDIKNAWQNAQLILLDGINPALSKYMFAKYQGYLAQFKDVAVVSLGDLANENMNQGLSEIQQKNIGAYYNNAGRQNYTNLMQYLATDIFKLSSHSVSNPIIVPNVGLYHPKFKGLVTTSETQFYTWLKPNVNKPVVAIAMHRSVIDYEQQQIVDQIINQLELKGAKAFGVFFEGNDENLTYPELLLDENKTARIDLLINYRSLHYVEKRKSEFIQIGVPVIHALNYTQGNEAEFNADNAGVSPSLTPFFLVMPEDTGSTDPTIIAANDNGIKKAMPEQLKALVERAYNHANLAHIKNSDKKIATFIWNYPPGEKNIGAAFLDVPSSINEIAKEMQKQGYQVNPQTAETLIDNAGKLLRPYYRNEDTLGLIAQGLADWLPLSTYLNWFNALPKEVSQPIVERWGKPQDNGMLANHNGEQAFVIPRMKLGNLIVLPQGVRGQNAKEHSSLYHSTKTPINHSYLAIYLYTRKVFGADAYIHLGTHGSQEWLTGKERGLSVFDAPSLAIGNLPVFYPYIIDNVGEAMQAKRRGRATMISHLTPGFAKAGLYTQVAKLNELLGNYIMLEQGQTKENTKNQIIKTSDELNILKDLSLTKDELIRNFAINVSRIQDHLNELAQQSQPLGVHIFGLLPEEAHLYSTMIQMLGEDFAKLAAHYEQESGLAITDRLKRDERDVVKLNALDGFQLLHAFINNKPLKNLPNTLTPYLTEAKTYWENFANIAEIKNLLGALSANYIPVSYGGDPIRNPQAAPTGRNLIGFNPAKVPSKEAYAAGVKLMNQTIDDYYAKNGRYPEKLAFSLWSLETMRHQGALEAQILHALGLKPKWDRQGNVSGTEVIPYSELKRPRIDVVISATGLYRDAFPNVMLWLAKAIDKIAKLKEDNNFVYRHANALKQNLLKQGKNEADADYLSSIRIFSNETGNYGTGLAATSLASDTWEDDSKLANLYLDRMGYAFGKDESRWSENVSDTKLYNQVLSGTDGVIFSRSTNLYALMTNDDPFQYFGGIGLAVRHLDGKTPKMYVSNLRRKDNVKVQTMKDFLNQEMRSRYFHPRWIQAMQDSGYAGATAILDRMNNMWGWEVMTPEAVRDDQWQEFFEVYVNDKYDLQMREFFEKHNAEALAQIIERMLEAVRKGYWQADAETIKKMLETYTEIANQHDVVTDNQKFTDYVQNQNAGFGLAALALANMQPQALPEHAKPNEQLKVEQVSGQKLEEVKDEAKEIEQDYTLWYLLGLIFIIGFLSNFVSLFRQQKLQVT